MSKSNFKVISNTSFGDRFIPNRTKFDFNLAHYKLTSNEFAIVKRDDIFEQSLQYMSYYKKLLKTALNINDAPILTVRNISNDCKKKKKAEKTINVDWPVKPRLQPVLHQPDIILDLPNISPAVVWNKLDWSSAGHLTTIWASKVYLWYAKREQKDEVISTGIPATGAVRWNHESTKLAVGNRASLCIWEYPTTKLLYSKNCCVFCKISILVWDQTDTYIISGCSKGILRVWNISNFKIEHQVYAHRGYFIVNLIICPSNRYLCCTDSNGRVRIWHWKGMIPHVEIPYTSIIRAIAFHPWQPGLLAVGAGIGDGSITLWNINNCTELCSMKPARESFVDCLTWSKISGELISSHQVKVKDQSDLSVTKYETKILVLANLNTVVDYMDSHNGRVMYLMWDKSGTRLATASTDECLCIWNFFGKNLNKNPFDHKTKRKQSILTNFEKFIR